MLIAMSRFGYQIFQTMKKLFRPLLLITASCNTSRNSLDINLTGEIPLKVESYADLSAKLVEKVRAGENLDDITETLANVTVDELAKDLTWNTDIKRFILFETEALVHLLAFKNKHNLELSQVVNDVISIGDLITTQAIIQKFDEV